MKRVEALLQYDSLARVKLVGYYNKVFENQFNEFGQKDYLVESPLIEVQSEYFYYKVRKDFELNTIN